MFSPSQFNALWVRPPFHQSKLMALPYSSYLILSGILALLQIAIDVVISSFHTNTPFTLLAPYFISLFSLIFCAIPSYKLAYKGIRKRVFIIEHAILASIGIAFIHGTWQLYYQHETPSFFNIIVYSIFLMQVRRYFSHYAANKPTPPHQLLNRFAPKTATLLENEESTIELSQVKPGQKLVVKAAQRIPADGVIISGECVIDESILSTNQSPVPKFVNDIVKCGTLNVEGNIIIQALKPYHLSDLGKTIALLDQSKNYKTDLDTNLSFVPWFFVIASIIALTTFFWWLPQNPAQAYYSLISIILLSSPVILGLVIPITYTLSIFLLKNRGIKVQRLKAFELLTHVQYMIFNASDKLTKKEVKVEQIDFKCSLEEQQCVLEKIAAIERSSSHPHSKAIYDYLQAQHVQAEHIDVHHLRLFPKRGLRGFIDNQQILIGTARWLKNNGISIPLEAINQEGHFEHALDLVYCAIDGKEVAQVHFTYTDHEIALPFLHSLNQQLAVSVFSTHKRNIENAFNHGQHHCHQIEVTDPKEKALHIANLQGNGHAVAMLGNHLDDTPALIQSDVAIVTSDSPAILRSCADIILPKGKVEEIIHCLKFSKLFIDIFKQNATLCFTFYLMMVPFAASGTLGAQKLALGSFGLISLMCLNAFRLLKGNMKDKHIFWDKERTVTIKPERLQNSHAT